MAGASTSVYAFSSVVSGQYKYKSARTSLTDKTCKCIMWEGNKCNEYIVNDQLFNVRIEDAHIKRDVENKFIFLNILHNLNIY